MPASTSPGSPSGPWLGATKQLAPAHHRESQQTGLAARYAPENSKGYHYRTEPRSIPASFVVEWPGQAGPRAQPSRSTPVRSTPTLTRWIASVALFVLAVPVHASAPMQKTQAPGFYRMMLGDFEVTVLSDGTLPFNVKDLLKGITPDQLDTALARAFLKEPVELSVNGFLINTGSKLVLIDTGTGPSFGPSVGKLLTNLRASGYEPEQVDDIFITHMHGDHIGGLTQDGKAVFSNATVHAARQEADYWLSETRLNAVPANQKRGLEQAIAIFKPYVAA